MPRRAAIALAITGLALVLLLNFKTPEAPVLAGSGTDTGTGGAAATASPSGSPTVGSSGATSTPQPTADVGADVAYADGTVIGEAVTTRFGSMQVEVVIADGRIVDVVTLEVPSRDRHSVELSERAASVLRTAVLEAQSAEVDLVSGATYSSDAYLRSVQSALDQAQA